MPDNSLHGDLLTTKLEVPLVGSRIVVRRRLTDMLTEGMKKQLMMLVAPAGYGKTTLVVEWLSEIALPDWRHVWLTIDSFDNQPCRLWFYIASAIKKIYPRMRYEPQRLYKDVLEKQSYECLTPLLNAIANVPFQLILVLDDYHELTNSEIHEEVRYLLDHQPKNLHLLISSRVVPPISISRLRAQRQLVELSVKDLSFNLKEAKHFFSSALEIEIDHDQATSMLVATEGWIAGMQLVTLSLRDKSDRISFIANLPVNNYQIFEYLTEEVLDHLAPELREFLLKTSILSELSAPLCDAVLSRSDSLVILKRLYQANLFISPLEENHNWFRYHRIFADILKKYLQTTYSTIISDLHRKACDWYVNNGQSDDAVTHALAIGDIELAAKIIDTCTLQAVSNFDLVKVVEWFNRFSDDVIRKRPQLLLYNALVNFILERFDQVEPKLQTLEYYLEASIQAGDQIEDEALIRWEIESLRVSLDCWQKSPNENLSKLLQLIQNAPSNDVYFRGFLYHNLATVYAYHGDLNAAINAYTKGCRFAIDHGSLIEYCYSQSELAYVRKMQGRLSDAEEDYHNLIEYALQTEMPNDVIAFAKTGLAEIALERNQTEKADELILWVIENLEWIETSPRNWIRQEWIFSRLSKYYLDRHDLFNARIYFKKAMEGYQSNPHVVLYLLYQLIDLNVEMWLALGKMNSRDVNIEDKIESLDPIGKAYLAKNTALIRYYINMNEINKASDILQKTIPQLVTLGMNERLMESFVLQSLACQALNDNKESMNSLHKALKIANSEGYRRVFSSKGKAMKPLLKRYLRQVQNADIEFDELLEKLTKDLLIGLEQEESTPFVPTTLNTRSPADLAKPILGPLTSRELEVVKLIVNGKSTKEIATKLTISLFTTKSHIKSVYRKLEVHSRSELLQRVLDLDLIKK